MVLFKKKPFYAKVVLFWKDEGCQSGRTGHPVGGVSETVSRVFPICLNIQMYAECLGTNRNPVKSGDVA